MQAELQRSGRELEAYEASLQTFGAHISAAMGEMSNIDDEFQRWLKALEEEFQGEEEGGGRLEKRLVAYDALTEQIVRLHAESLAIEDAMFYLEKGLEGASDHCSVDAASHVKSMRRLAKQQFICKALLQKIQDVLSTAQ